MLPTAFSKWSGAVERRASLVSSFDASAAEDLLSIFPKEPRDARRSAGLIRWKCAAILASNVGEAITRPR